MFRLPKARKVIIEEPYTAPGLDLVRDRCLILALGIAYYFERQGQRESGHTK